MKADTKTEAAVIAVLNKLVESYTKRDLAGVLSVIAPDPDAVMFGTGADEKRVGLAEIKAQVERDWSQADSASISYGWTLVSAAGSVAWIAGDVTFSGKAGGQEFTLAGRLTAVLEKRGDKWLIVQSHFSMPLAGQAEGESFPA